MNRERMDLYCDNHTRHVDNQLCGKNAGLLVSNMAVDILSTVSYKLNRYLHTKNGLNECIMVQTPLYMALWSDIN